MNANRRQLGVFLVLGGILGGGLGAKEPAEEKAKPRFCVIQQGQETYIFDTHSGKMWSWQKGRKVLVENFDEKGKGDRPTGPSLPERRAESGFSEHQGQEPDLTPEAAGLNHRASDRGAPAEARIGLEGPDELQRRAGRERLLRYLSHLGAPGLTVMSTNGKTTVTITVENGGTRRLRALEFTLALPFGDGTETRRVLLHRQREEKALRPPAPGEKTSIVLELGEKDTGLDGEPDCRYTYIEFEPAEDKQDSKHQR